MNKHKNFFFSVILLLAAGLSACGGGDPSSSGETANSGTAPEIGNDKYAAVTETWTKCANEDGICNFTGTRTVRYGLNGMYATKTATDSIPCTNQEFGDPLPGADKICEYALETPPPSEDPPPPTTNWTRCAVEDAVCVFEGTRQVRYGANGTYNFKTATGSIPCTNSEFGDPVYGVDKYCDYAGTTTTTSPPEYPPPAESWTFCAKEDALCSFTGTREVRYGANGTYAYRTATDSIECSNSVFGDPVYGVGKICEYASTTPSTALPSKWSDLISFPIVPVAAANLPDGKVLTWSAYSPTTFGGDQGQTYSSIFDPATQSASTRIVSETGHDMFCPGTTLLSDGRLLVNGGSSSQKTSIYDPASDSWTVGALMNVPRGYQGNTILSNGSVLTLGGSWSGGIGGKTGELYTPGGGWQVKSGIPIEPFLGPDPRGEYRSDNHLWLFSQADGKVFHAGPSAAMHWIDTAGNGQVTFAGNRGDDAYSMNGNAVMYDIGKILKTGGAPAYEEADATAASYVIDISSGNVTTRKIAPMNYARAIHNSVVLPNGQVVISGGQSYVKIFSDERSVLMTEIWDPATEKFTTLSASAVPRNYHSFSLLLPDGRVLIGGGGLCDFNCTTNHLDAQILTPPYLLNADGTDAVRPAIASAPASARYGGTMTVATDSAVSSFALIRLSSVTHSVNNDQRRVPLQAAQSGPNSYTVQIPGSAGIVPPGYYMLFAMNANGVPSVSRTVQIR